MGEQSIRALLTLMNMSASEGTEWCAWQPVRSQLDKDYHVREHWRFYLVEEGSQLHEDNTGTILWGN